LGFHCRAQDDGLEYRDMEHFNHLSFSSYDLLYSLHDGYIGKSKYLRRRDDMQLFWYLSAL
jgi:hypothetical protein